MPFLRRSVLIFLLFFPFSVLYSQEEEPEPETETETDSEFNIEEARERIFNEAPAEFMNLSVNDANVSLTLSGSWKGILQGNIGFMNSPFGPAAVSPETPLLFQQEADITLSLFINNKWFVEANFQDESFLNTYRAGYQGGPGDFVKYAGIGNAGLDFPSFAYLDLGGDAPSSFGYYGRMGTDSLNIHSLLRFDSASREEKVFLGNRERTVSYAEPQNYMRGVSFVLPKSGIDSEITVYLEDSKGNLEDGNGRRWRLAHNSEYAAGRLEGLVELNARPSRMAAVSYNGVNDNTVISQYLNDVKDWFPEADEGCSEIIQINNADALVIYEPGLFSPYERLNRYGAPSSYSEDAYVVRMSNNSIRNDFGLVLLREISAQEDLPLFMRAQSARAIYELLPTDGNAKNIRRSPQSMWPLAKESPEIYFPVKDIYTKDTMLRFTNYSGGAGFYIGCDAVPGSVQVVRSGIHDSNFIYNADSGEVILNSAPAQNEIIRISYLKRGEETRLGSIAAGIGVVYRNGQSPFSVESAAGIRWNITEDSAFTDENNSSAGAAGASVKTAWDYDFLRARAAAGFIYENMDTTGLYRAEGMENSQTILPLPPNASFRSNVPETKIAPPGFSFSVNNRADLIYKNYYNTTILGSTLMPITWGNAQIISNMNKPYPVKDPSLGDRQLLALEFNMKEGEWTGFHVPIEGEKEIIARAREIRIPYKLYSFSPDSALADFKIIFQLGSISPEGYSFIENIELIYETELDAGAVNEEKILIIRLEDEDRKKLANADHLRALAVNGAMETVSGIFLLAPPVFYGSVFRPLEEKVYVYETVDAGLENAQKEIIKRLHPGGAVQRALKIEWENLAAGVSAGIDGRIGEMPLNNYRELSFFIKTSELGAGAGNLRLVIAPSFELRDVPYLKAEIPLSAFESEWSKVTARYQGDNAGIFINGKKIANAELTYYNNRANNPVNYIALYIDPLAGSSLAEGGYSIDEIILEDPASVYRFNAGSSAEYKRPGVLLSIGNVPVFSDFTAHAAFESEMRMSEKDIENDFYGSIVSKSMLETGIFGVNARLDFSFMAAENSFVWTAGHLFSRAINGFSFKEEFTASPYDGFSRHSFNLAYASDFFAKFDADAQYEHSRLKQNWNYNIGYTPKNILIPSVSASSKISWLSAKNEYYIKENENYGEIWAKSWEPLVPDLGGNASLRNTNTRFILAQRTKPVGAVLTLEGTANFSLINDFTRAENSLFFDIPAEINKYTFNFRMGRKFSRNLNYSGDDVTDESNILFESIRDSKYFWGVFPFYSLFSGDLHKAMDETINDYRSKDITAYTGFGDHFSFDINFPSRYDLLALVIPSKTSFSLERNLEQRMDTRNDVLNLGAGARFSAINMFGSMGYKPLFSFYQIDEFNNAFQAAFVFKNNEDVLWRLQHVFSAGLRFANTGAINSYNTLTLRGGNYWTESLTVSWIAPAENILINEIYKRIHGSVPEDGARAGLASILNADYQKLRRESLELIFENITEYLKWSAALSHEEIIRVAGRMEFTGFVKLRFGEDLSLKIFSMDMVLGTSLRITF